MVACNMYLYFAHSQQSKQSKDTENSQYEKFSQLNFFQTYLVTVFILLSL